MTNFTTAVEGQTPLRIAAKLSLEYEVEPSSKSLAGKTAIVTGAARGIGAATAISLARQGAFVYVNDILSPDDTLKAIREAGGEGEAAIADVTDRAAVNTLVDHADASRGIDVLVTNAAYSDRELFYKCDQAGFDKTIDVCMWGPFNFLRAVANKMIARGTGGSVVCISSPHAFKAIPGAMAYNMAKAAVDQMARTAACELSEHRIRVNIVHPGWTNTPGERKFFHENELKVKGSELPWGRLAEPDEIARVVVFLCETGSDYINGATLSVDGGALLPHEQMFRVQDRPN